MGEKKRTRAEKQPGEDITGGEKRTRVKKSFAEKLATLDKRIGFHRGEVMRLMERRENMKREQRARAEAILNEVEEADKPLSESATEPQLVEA